MARLLVLVVGATEDCWIAGASVDVVGFCEGVDTVVESVGSLTEMGEVAGVEADEAVAKMIVEDVELSSEVLAVVLEGTEELETSDEVAGIYSGGDATG